MRGRYRVFAARETEYPERVVRLMRESVVVDMLNQFLYRFDQKDLKESGSWSRAHSLRKTGFASRAAGVHAINFGDGAHKREDARSAVRQVE